MEWNTFKWSLCHLGGTWVSLINHQHNTFIKSNRWQWPSAVCLYTGQLALNYTFIRERDSGGDEQVSYEKQENDLRLIRQTRLSGFFFCLLSTLHYVIKHQLHRAEEEEGKNVFACVASNQWKSNETRVWQTHESLMKTNGAHYSPLYGANYNVTQAATAR